MTGLDALVRAVRAAGRRVPPIRWAGRAVAGAILREFQRDAAATGAAGQDGGQAMGAAPLWVPPGHFFSPVTDPGELAAITPSPFDADAVPAWTPPPGIDLNAEAQAEVAGRIAAARASLPLEAWRTGTGGTRYTADNPAFPLADAMVLGGLMAAFAPRRVVEIGSGHSTCALLDIRDALPGDPATVTLVEPYPQLLRSLLRPGDPERVTLIPTPAQALDLDVVRALEAGDILFIDSTHVAKTGSDVLHHFFATLPAVAPGVLIHLHDVFWGFEYPHAWAVAENRSWNELYLLRAFLMHNRDYEILFFPDWYRRAFPEAARRALPELMEASVTSFWMRKR